MKFECTTRFKKEFKELKKKNSKIVQDLYKDLFSLTLDELFTHHQLLGKEHPIVRLKKHRACNSSRNQSASGGFRIYFHINRDTKTVRLMTIYCKVGKNSKITLLPNEIDDIKKELKEHRLNDAFISMDVSEKNINFNVPVKTN